MAKKIEKDSYLMGTRLLPILEGIAYRFENEKVSYKERLEYLMSQCDRLKEYDWISLPDGTTYEKTYEPKRKK